MQSTLAWGSRRYIALVALWRVRGRWSPASCSLPVDAAGRTVHLLQADMTCFSLVALFVGTYSSQRRD